MRVHTAFWVQPRARGQEEHDPLLRSTVLCSAEPLSSHLRAVWYEPDQGASAVTLAQAPRCALHLLLRAAPVAHLAFASALRTGGWDGSYHPEGLHALGCLETAAAVLLPAQARSCLPVVHTRARQQPWSGEVCARSRAV